MPATSVVGACTRRGRGRGQRARGATVGDDAASGPCATGKVDACDVFCGRKRGPRSRWACRSRRCRRRTWRSCEPPRGVEPGDMDAVRELYDPDVDRAPIAGGWPEPGPIVGREAVMRQSEQLRETWDADELNRSATSSTPATELSCGHVWRGAGSGPRADLESDERLHGAQGQDRLVRSSSGITPRPSKPWGCRSRRCRRRTWSSCEPSIDGVERARDYRSPHRSASTPTSSLRPRLRWPMPAPIGAR